MFDIQDFNQIPTEIMNNKKFYIFLLSIVEMFPSYSSICWHLDLEDQLFVKQIWEILQSKPSFEEFKKIRISKDIIFQIIKSVLKNVFYYNID